MLFAATLLAVLLAAVVVARLSRRRFVSPPSAPDDGRLRLRDLTIGDVCSGQNWKLTVPEEMAEIGTTLNMEDVHLEAADSFTLEDTVAYAAVCAQEDGQIVPLVLVKTVGYLDYGGDWCDYREGRWRQVGLVPNPNAPRGEEFIANPLAIDPSFETGDPEQDYRAAHRAGFLAWVARMPRGQAGAPQDLDEPGD